MTIQFQMGDWDIEPKMKKFIYSIAVEVIAENQDEATWKIYNTKLDELKTDCFEIEIEEID